jgi:hypothetical protein
VSPAAAEKLERAKIGCPLTPIGFIARGSIPILYTREKRFQRLADVGYEHT